MKVYTKTGDKGDTSLFGGSRFSKGHLRIHAYGTVDELNSYIGLLSDLSSDESRKSELLRIQDRLFTLGALLATENEASKKRLPSITIEDVDFLEASIDKMEVSLDPIKTFVLPGGHPTVSYCHISRCVCRRAERICVELSEMNKVEEVLIKYLNRFFVILFCIKFE